MSVLGFYLPPDSGEKATLGITVLLALTFFVRLVSEMQPLSSNVPIISAFFVLNMANIASSVVRG